MLNNLNNSLMIKQPSSMNKAWTQEEDQMLVSLIKRKADGVTISNVLGRTRASILNRKFVLGIEERIQRSPVGTGKTVPLSFRKTGSKKSLNPDASKPTVKEPVVKEKTLVYKVLFIHRNMRRGDISEIAKKLGVTVGHVSAVLNGTYENKTIIDLAYTFFLERSSKERI
jgi:hypothetical protein